MNATAQTTRNDTDTEKPKLAYAHRWWITCTFTNNSPLAIGDGTTILGNELEDGAMTQVNAVALNASGKPYLSGTALKGALRALSEKLNATNPTLSNHMEQLFGATDAKRRQSGMVDFYDAHFGSTKITDDTAQNLANFCSTRKTYQETSTSIDRDRGTAKDRHLFTTEYVPAGTTFSSTMLVQHHGKEMGEALVKHLASLLNAATPQGGLTLGADTRRGYGRLECSSLKVNYFGADELTAWLTGGCKNTWQKSASEVENFAACVLSPSATPMIQIELKIAFTGLFLVNEPARTSKGTNAIAHAPRLDAKGNPVLPAKTLHGALRSQSEKILRTLGIACSGAGGVPANQDENIAAMTNAGDALIVELYGNTHNASKLTQPAPPQCTNSGVFHKQDFIAIDRFTGGGKDGAKFNAHSFYQPKFSATLQISSHLRDAAKGLLLLTLRDLAEGDIPLGWGKRKDYGACTVTAKGGANLTPTAATALSNNAAETTILKALRDLANANGTPITINSSLTQNLPQHTPDTKRPTTTTTKEKNHFHNTYHFIPATKVDLPAWAKRTGFEDKDKTNWKVGGTLHAHSHAIYGSTVNEPLHSGVIECKLTAETPFIVGGVRRKNEDKNEDKSETVFPYKLGEKFVIPSSTLKGCIGSIAEAASGSAMRVLDTEAIISYRFKAASALRNLGIFLKDTHGNLLVEPLTKDNHYSKFLPSATPKTRYFALMLPQLPNARQLDDKPARKEIEFTNKPSRTSQSALTVNPDAMTSFALLANQQTLLYLGKHANDDAYPSGNLLNNEILSAPPYHRVECVATPNKPGSWSTTLASLKRNENQNPKIKFEQLALTPKPGDLVYYSKVGNTVTQFAYSAIWRGLITYKHRAVRYQDFLAHTELQPFAPVRHHISPAEMLLGFVEITPKTENVKDTKNGLNPAPQALAFAGKLRFSDAVCNESINTKQVALKLLSSPKPPSPAMYFRGTNADKYIPKAELSPEKHRLHGRKHYLHALRKPDGTTIQPLDTNGVISDDGTLPWQAEKIASPPKPNKPNGDPVDEHDKQRVHAQLLPEKTKFTFNIAFDNLSDTELALLAFALKPDDNFRHKLGMGKAIGLGSMHLEPTAIKLINRQQRYGSDAINESRYHVEDKNLLQTFAKHYRESASGSSEAKTALLALGNPKNVVYPVHVPQLLDLPIETETYQWFTNNDSDTGGHPAPQFLTQINNPHQLPSLERVKKYEKP